MIYSLRRSQCERTVLVRAVGSDDDCGTTARLVENSLTSARQPVRILLYRCGCVNVVIKPNYEYVVWDFFEP